MILIVHSADEINESNENELFYDEHLKHKQDAELTRQINKEYNESHKGKSSQLQAQSMELQIDDDIDNQSAPKIMQLHFQYESNHSSKQEYYHQETSTNVN
ncbi:unnamed protein product [Rotaria sp. Silwood1]|nr:unnamed protein product [Rotaria sp. Silwood1]